MGVEGFLCGRLSLHRQRPPIVTLHPIRLEEKKKLSKLFFEGKEVKKNPQRVHLARTGKLLLCALRECTIKREATMLKKKCASAIHNGVRCTIHTIVAVLISALLIP